MGALNNASKSSSTTSREDGWFGVSAIKVRGAESTAPCLLSIITFCFPSGMSSSSSLTPSALFTTGTSDRKSRSSDDNNRESLPKVGFGREKRFKNLETADCAGPSVVTIGSIGFPLTSPGVDNTGEAVFVDETETEAVITGGTGGGFVSRLPETDCGLRSSVL